MKVPINKIINISSVDGPGSRTVIFLQKCNISCLYCHNPETQKICNSCGLCVSNCPKNALSINFNKKNISWNEQICIHCDTCINICKNFSSPKIRYMNPTEVFESIKKNIPIIRGITVSGGECTLYPEFLAKLFSLVKLEGLTCYIDTNGCVDLSKYYLLMQQCDKVMLDVKSWNNDNFYNLTGSDNDIVKKNLLYLAKERKLQEVRIVCIEPEVDVCDTIEGIAEITKDYINEFTLKLITFRKYGVKTSLVYSKPPSQDRMNYFIELAKSKGFSNICVV